MNTRDDGVADSTQSVHGSSLQFGLCGIALGICAAAISAVVAVFDASVLKLVLALSPVLVLVLLVRSRNPFFLSPFSILVTVFSGFAVVGHFVDQRRMLEAGGVSMRLGLSTTDTSRTINLFVLTALALTVGYGIGVMLGWGGVRNLRLTRSVSLPSVRLLRRAFLLCLLPAVLIIVSAGLADLMDRKWYLGEDSGSLVGVGASLGMAALALLGVIAGASRGYLRVLALILVLIYFVLFLSFGSRRMVLVLPIFALGVFAAKMTRRAKLCLLLAVLSSLILLPVPLQLRALSRHGLVPYVNALPDLFIGGDAGIAALNNLFFSFPLAGTVAYRVGDIPFSSIWTELNPLPGTFTSWYEIAPTLRLNTFTPYSAVGEVANAGMPMVFIFWMGLGITYAYLEKRIACMIVERREAIALIVLALTVMFAFVCLQYNLRNSIRLVLYALLVDILVVVAVRWRRGWSTQAAPTQRLDRGSTDFRPSRVLQT